MKFPFARGALALTALLTLASCGGGGKATFPINVSVYNVQYDGLILTTNGQDLAIHPGSDPNQPVNAVFPNQIEYGEVYTVVPKSVTSTGSDGKAVTSYQYPLHQTCSPATGYPVGLPINGTAGQLAKIQINYVCSVNTYPLTGKVTGLLGTGLTLANGSGVAPIAVAPDVDATTKAPTGKEVALVMNQVAFNTTYGVTVLTQPTNPTQTCTVTGGGNGQGAGTMDLAAEAKGGVTDLVVDCK